MLQRELEPARCRLEEVVKKLEDDTSENGTRKEAISLVRESLETLAGAQAVQPALVEPQVQPVLDAGSGGTQASTTNLGYEGHAVVGA
ncbi:unnamed protein product [Amoebophrya sp. A25]|nr:unnamed protein product [Amoebophrya sp. A25]|eukprot:GSA25T00027451001.1